jgi:pteridine reductase
MLEKPLNGKIALVTGAARRIGRAIALELASLGANIAVHYRESGEDAKALCRDLEALGVTCWLFQADFREREGYEDLIDRAFTKMGRLDVLVNSASIFPENSIHDVRWEDMEQNILINAWAPFYMGRAFARKAVDGVIINLLDTRITGHERRHVAYLMSKKLLEAFTSLMALEFAPRIRVNAVAPGLILPPPGRDEAYLEKLIERVPLKRKGDEKDIAHAVSFLVMNEYVTGQVIFVDGGRHVSGE